MIRINNIKIKENLSNEKVLETAIRKYKINNTEILEWHISKKSIDARKKNDIHYTYAIDLKLKNEDIYINKYKNISKIKKSMSPNITVKISSSSRPVIVGAGPARSICCTYIYSKRHKTNYYRTRRKS